MGSLRWRGENMTLSPTEVVVAILKNPTDIENVRSLVADNVTYVSLNYENLDLKKIMPWAGTSRGAESIVKTFVDVGRFWDNLAFEIEALFGSGENVAMFGRFTYKSNYASLRRVFEGFTFVRLSDAHLPKVFLELFPQRSPPRLFTAAAWSGLRPAPESRPQ
jgi:hypothetical protein